MKIGIAVAAAVAVALAPTSSAHSATLRTSHYAIDAMAMGPEQVSSSTNYGTGSGDGLRNIAASRACFNAAIHLPQGAAITRVIVWHSSTATSSTNTGVVRQRLSDGQFSYVAAREIGNTNGQRKAVTVPILSDPIGAAPAIVPVEPIDNARFSYSFGICLNGLNKSAFHGARITYTYLD